MALFDTVYPSQNPADAEGVKLGAQRIRELKDKLQVLLQQLFNDDTTLKTFVDTAELIDKAVTLAKMADGARGSLITFNSSLRPILLALGANGFLPFSNGTDVVWRALTQSDISGLTFKGVPNFITPVDIVSGVTTALPWTTYNSLAANGVPVDASAIILQEDHYQGGPDSGALCEIDVRKSSSDPSYVLGRGASSGTADGTAGANQGIYPFLVTGPVLSFDYQIQTGFNFGANIRLVGYIS